MGRSGQRWWRSHGRCSTTESVGGASQTVTSTLTYVNAEHRPQDRYGLYDWILNRHLRRRHRRRQGPGWSQVSRDESLLHACLQWLSRSCDSYPLTAASCLPFLLLLFFLLRFLSLATAMCVRTHAAFLRTHNTRIYFSLYPCLSLSLLLSIGRNLVRL